MSDKSQREQEQLDQEKLEKEQLTSRPNSYIAKVKHIFSSFWLHLRDNLTTSQKMYLAAFVLMVFALQEEGSVFDGLTLTGALALAAMFSEVWPRFVKVWETLLGRVFIVLFYAIIANLAVAIAAQKVNEVVGIDPSPLFYTLGFTTVLLAPLWFLGLTVVSMIVYMIVLQLWLILVFLLKLIRVPIYKNRGKRAVSHPILTNVLRVVLIPVMLTSLASVAELYVGELDFNSLNPSKQHVSRLSNDIKETVKNQAEKENGKPLTDEEKTELELILSSVEKELNITPQDLNIATSPENDRVMEDFDLNDVTSESNVASDKSSEENNIADNISGAAGDKKVSTIIAWFVHNIETFEYSQCVKADDERAVYIGETDILVSRENPEAPFGIEFSARTCELNVKK